ncbi:MAG: archaetidylserine decarboxylase [Planctomycetota bacterium]
MPATSTRIARFFQQEDLNFLLTNRIPRRLVTRLVGWFSRIESRWLTKASIAVWRRFSPDLDLSDAKAQSFSSLHECFVRELRDGARPIDPRPDIVVSPCDAVVGAHGDIDGIELIQAKGFPYTLADLLGDDAGVARYRDGRFVTLRLKSSMYHRFHAPCDARIRRVRYISGDTWNVNPIALARVEKLFCKNERAVLDLELGVPDYAITLVPVAAILVASIRLHLLEGTLDLRSRGLHEIPCDAELMKGKELGYFQHGSTIIVFATPQFRLVPSVRQGEIIRMGEPLFRADVELSAEP